LLVPARLLCHVSCFVICYTNPRLLAQGLYATIFKQIVHAPEEQQTVLGFGFFEFHQASSAGQIFLCVLY
jgi:hypothetical protein